MDEKVELTHADGHLRRSMFIDKIMRTAGLPVENVNTNKIVSYDFNRNNDGKVLSRQQGFGGKVLYTFKQKLSLPISVVSYTTSLAVKTVALVLGLLLLSVICYLLIYSYYIPQYSMTRPLLFYRKTMTKVREGLDGKETSIMRTIATEISVSDTEFYMMPGQNYKITLNLDMPESAVNAYVGCFNLKSTIRGDNGRILAEQERLIQLTYKSPMVRYVESWIYLPLYLIGWSEERCQTSADLFRNYKEGFGDRQTSMLELSIDNPEVQIYEASVSIQTLYSGLRYYMYYWRITTALIIITSLYLGAIIVVSLNFFMFQLGITSGMWHIFLSWLPFGRPTIARHGQGCMNGSFYTHYPKPT